MQKIYVRDRNGTTLSDADSPMRKLMLLDSAQDLFECVAHDLYLIFGEIVVKWQGNGTLADRLSNGEGAGCVTVLLYEEGLKMDWREVIAGLNALMLEFAEKFISLRLREVGRQSDDIHEPTHFAGCGYGLGNYSGIRDKSGLVPLSDFGPFSHDFLNVN